MSNNNPDDPNDELISLDPENPNHPNNKAFPEPIIPATTKRLLDAFLEDTLEFYREINSDPNNSDPNNPNPRADRYLYAMEHLYLSLETRHEFVCPPDATDNPNTIPPNNPTHHSPAMYMNWWCQRNMTLPEQERAAELMEEHPHA